MNFENDSSWDSESKRQSVPGGGWKKKYADILQQLGISEEQLQKEGVMIIDIDGSNF